MVEKFIGGHWLSIDFYTNENVDKTMASNSAPPARLIRSVLSLVGGAAASQLVGFISLPFLARLYQPSDFGLYGTFVLSTQLLALALAGRYEQPIMLAQRPEARTGLALISLTLALAFGLLAALAASLFPILLDRWSGLQLGLGWTLVAASGTILSWNTTLTGVAIRSGRTNVAAGNRMTKAITTVSVQFAFALCLPLTFRHWGLIAGEVVAIAFSTTTMVINLRDSDILQFRQRIRRNGFRTGIPALLKRFRRFPLVNAPHAISSAAVGLLTVSYIALHFSTVEAGQYFLMFRVVMLPASLIGSAVAPVYFRSAADSYARDGRFEQLMWRMTAALAAVGLVVFSVLASVGEPLFVIVLGEKWRHAGALAAIFAPYVPIHLIVSSLAPTTMVANALTQALYASLGQSVVFLFGLWLGAQIYGTIGGAVALAVYLSVPYMVALALWYARLARGKRQVPA